MGFMIYRCRPAEDLLRYEQIKTLSLGGANGAIARFIRNSPRERLAGNWKMTPEELVEFSGSPGIGCELAVLLDMAPRDPSAVCLYQLQEIRGVCQPQSTQLALDFTVLLDHPVAARAGEYKISFTIPAVWPQKRLLEILVLNGGLEGGDWTWGTPAMNLGATFLGASQRQLAEQATT